MTRPRASERIDHEHALTGEKLCLMAVFAYPDEESLGPAGVLARYAGEGVRVSMVTVTRGKGAKALGLPTRSGGAETRALREQTCSCLTSGTHRICLLDHSGDRIDLADEALMEERLVRLIREQRPQVVLTYGPDGLGDPSHPFISRAVTRAFAAAGDPARYPQHFPDGLMRFQPGKLYYAVIPRSILDRFPLPGLYGVDDSAVTTVVDVSLQSEAKLQTLYCQRDHIHDFGQLMIPGSSAGFSDREYFILAASNLARRPRKEKDLFAGIR